MALPPEAELSVEGGDAVAGQLGSFTWAGAGSDAPWLPGSPITVAAGEPLSVTVRPVIPVTTWRARYARAGQSDPAGARPLGTGVGEPSFGAPAAGQWTVEVVIGSGGGLDEASYFWRVDVR
jgi:hypothetical protein